MEQINFQLIRIYTHQMAALHCARSTRLNIPTLCPGKKDQNFFVISSIKLGRFS